MLTVALLLSVRMSAAQRKGQLWHYRGKRDQISWLNSPQSALLSYNITQWPPDSVLHCGKTLCTFKAMLCTFAHSPASWCNHARLPAMGSGCVRAGLQPVHGGAAVGTVPWHPYGVQASDGGSAVLLGHRLWQQHLPECPRVWPASPLPGGILRKSSESPPLVRVSLFQTDTKQWHTSFWKKMFN